MSKRWRIKTEAEFIEMLGTNWRKHLHYEWHQEMNQFFGKEYAWSEENIDLLNRGLTATLIFRTSNLNENLNVEILEHRMTNECLIFEDDKPIEFKHTGNIYTAEVDEQ